MKAARVANELIKDAYSLECWGGATFDVCMRFFGRVSLGETARTTRRSSRYLLAQMLIRGANAVGYTSYPDNVVEEFIRLAALNGMDIFRIFDCFNIVENMQVAINAVRKPARWPKYVCATPAISSRLLSTTLSTTRVWQRRLPRQEHT